MTNENGGQLQKMLASGGPAKWTPVFSMQMARIVELLAHLPQRAMSDAGGAMLDYDCLLHLVFCFIMQKKFISLPFVFRITGILQ